MPLGAMAQLTDGCSCWPAVDKYGGGCLQEGPASELWGLRMYTGYHREKETVGPYRAALHWTAGGKLITFASDAKNEGVNLLEEREWVAWEVLAWLEQVGGRNSSPSDSSMAGRARTLHAPAPSPSV
jgi:hypothetical protein